MKKILIICESCKWIGTSDLATNKAQETECPVCKEQDIIGEYEPPDPLIKLIRRYIERYLSVIEVGQNIYGDILSDYVFEKIGRSENDNPSYIMFLLAQMKKELIFDYEFVNENELIFFKK